MNERILLFARRHGFIHDHMTVSERNDAIAKYERFAELLIRECADRIKLANRFDEITDDWVYLALQEDLKEYFGIKAFPPYS